MQLNGKQVKQYELDYNLVVIYWIRLFMFLIFILFITNEMDKRKKDREQWLSNQLSKSFEKGKKCKY